MPSTRNTERLTQGRGAIFSLMKAAELLPIADNEAREWLRNQGLIVTLCGREVVIWDQVIDALASPAVPSVTGTKRRLGLRRARLD